MPKQLSGPTLRDRNRKKWAVLFTEIPKELDKVVKHICVDAGMSRSAWVRKLVTREVRKQAARLGLKVDFLTGEARMRETGRVLPGMGEPDEKGD